MYKSTVTYAFPRLVFLKDVSFKGWSDPNKTTKLYKLDWDGFDEVIKKRHTEHNAKCWPTSTIPLIQKFYIYYEDLLQSLKFALPTSYLNEIRRVTQAAEIEFSINRNFDTNIREMCHKPAISYTQVAFNLLCDCIYDEATNFYYRAENKYLIAPMLMFRFWQHQTGTGMIEKFSDFDELELRLLALKNVKNRCLGMEDEISSLEKFLYCFRDHAEKIQRAFSDNTKLELGGSHIATGPSLGEGTAELEKKSYRYI
jgi:hypothetical protein